MRQKLQHLKQANWLLNRNVRDECRTTTTLKVSKTVACVSPLFGDHRIRAAILKMIHDAGGVAEATW